MTCLVRREEEEEEEEEVVVVVVVVVVVKRPVSIHPRSIFESIKPIVSLYMIILLTFKPQHY